MEDQSLDVKVNIGEFSTKLTNTKKPKQYLHPLDDDEYELIKLLVKGEFRKPIKERTRKEKSTVIKFWRNKNRFEIRDDSKLYFGGKEVVTKSNIKRIVDKTRDVCQLKNKKKIRQQVAHNYAGLSERQIIRFVRSTNVDDEKNIDILPELSANKVMSQWLVSLLQIKERENDTRLMLVTDVRSHFIWLVMLESFTHAEIQLERIFNEHGLPGNLNVICGENGDENVKKMFVGIFQLCATFDVSCSSISKEVLTDLGFGDLETNVTTDLMQIQQKQDEFTWNTELLRYTRECNIRPRKELKWNCPFEIFHGKPWRFKKEKLTVPIAPSFVHINGIREQTDNLS